MLRRRLLHTWYEGVSATSVDRNPFVVCCKLCLELESLKWLRNSLGSSSQLQCSTKKCLALLLLPHLQTVILCSYFYIDEYLRHEDMTSSGTYQDSPSSILAF